MVSVRQELSPQERATIAWPVTSHIIAPEAFEKIAAHITTRCWMYRVRLAAGEVDADDLDGAMTNPRIHEMVIDLAGPRPRIAYLRDITLLQDAALMALQASQAEPAAFSADEAAAVLEPTVEDDSPARLPATSQPSAAAPEDVAATRAAEDEGAPDAGDGPPRQPRVGRWTSG
jgi:hypothetical protein